MTRILASGSKAISKLVKGRWAPWLIGPAIGLSFGALGLEAHDVWRTLRSSPVSTAAMERVTDLPLEKEASNAVGAIDESPQENTRMGRWKRAVEAALKDAGSRQGEDANGARAIGNAESKPPQEKGAAELKHHRNRRAARHLKTCRKRRRTRGTTRGKGSVPSPQARSSTLMSLSGTLDRT